MGAAPEPSVLVINAGSSSIKYSLIDPETGVERVSGVVERIGEGFADSSGDGSGDGISNSIGRVVHHVGGEEFEESRPIHTHTEGFQALRSAFERAGMPLSDCGIVAVGHRVVQGGSQFADSTLIDDAVAEQIRELGSLAPLHNPGNAAAIDAARHILPEVPHVAVFDTSFHQTMPEAAYTYAIDPEVAREHGVRRYGFHGVSHQVVSRLAAEFLGRPLESFSQIVLHLGNGASMCAIASGRSVATTMGLTPLEGLVMGTRSGDIDPGALLHLLRSGLTVDELDALLNSRSGLRGLAGSNDLRDIDAAMSRGDARARLAFEVYVRRIRHYLGAYLVELAAGASGASHASGADGPRAGGVSAIVFTGGVGENQPRVRAAVCAGLESFGIEIDAARNESASRDARRISSDDSRIAVLVVPTDEEAEIAREALRVSSL